MWSLKKLEKLKLNLKNSVFFSRCNTQKTAKIINLFTYHETRFLNYPFYIYNDKLNKNFKLTKIILSANTLSLVKKNLYYFTGIWQFSYFLSIIYSRTIHDVFFFLCWMIRLSILCRVWVISYHEWNLLCVRSTLTNM